MCCALVMSRSGPNGGAFTRNTEKWGRLENEFRRARLARASRRRLLTFQSARW